MAVKCVLKGTLWALVIITKYIYLEASPIDLNAFDSQ